MERKERRNTKKVVKKIDEKDKKSISEYRISYKVLRNPANFILVFGILYIMLIILSIIGRMSTLEYTSTTDVTFGAVLKEFLIPFVTAVLFIIVSVIYRKKPMYGAALELGVGFSMIANILVSVFTAGFDIAALIITLIIPMIVILHSILALKNIKKEEKKTA